ncbi:hypothetical protein BV25DRAFT_20689 [Artomyces pyxidatus]|uniref:Uncharacterized protein n=1 Tax=Artomyces pyxidatus TaxID=48021 RepID=A0ACB8TJM5_9AGAM|nr:hypothetical protein BV25DRAFT_20689 [Artomyces pyxidatus]
MSGVDITAPVDWSKYKWRASPDDPTHYSREAAGSEVIEDVWHRFVHGEQFLFHGTNLTFNAAISPEDLLAHTRKAWVALRFTNPLIGAHTEYTEANVPLITYRSEADVQKVEAWAQRTVKLASNVKDIDELRFELSKVTLPDSNQDQTFVHILQYSETKYGFLLHTSHIPFDGSGVNIIINSLLAKIARSLGGKEETFQWGTEAVNLPLVSHDLIEVKEDSEFHETLGSVLGDLATHIPKRHGFKERSIGPGPTRRLGFRFSAEESQKILDGIKQAGFTVNQFLNAALTIVAYLDNPPASPSSSDGVFVYYGLVDGRKQLPSAHRRHPGYSLAVSGLYVPVKAVGEAIAQGEKHALHETAKIMRTQYLRQAAYKNLLAVQAPFIDIFLTDLRRGIIPPPAMGPSYAGDGVADDYLDGEYKDDAGVVRITIDNMFVSLNKTDPGPFFRAYTFKKQLNLSVDYNEHAMPRDVVQGFLDKWAELTRLIVF